MTTFTPVASLLGGLLIGLSAVLLMAAQGRIAGISGIVSRLLPPAERGGFAGGLAFVAGLVAAPLIVVAVTGTPVVQAVSGNLALMVAAGLLVGFGSVWGSGCTSGHGVCGIARLSPRSLVATLVFMAVAGITVFVMRHGMGG
ncbi:YeeE/YedE family protein [Azorhizobium sp. AG788]|uniref:YeeE/YedE family protein n=1 Tax=Azorhizobium sp. AG788 TaxID=2183897 RepID=UPI003139668D